jgi:UDP-3-O-[3-hydroxymyristoyl] glucosamine N-acyltransferase
MDYRGGICLDSYEEVPENYKDVLYIGKNVIIKSGTILAGDGFGYTWPALLHKEHRHGVQIHENVHIGSNCTVDRGRIRDTIIGENTKIDNGVHIAHGVVIGKNCLIGPHVTIAGSVEIGDNCQIWSNSFIHQGVKIVPDSVIGCMSYVRHDIKRKGVYYGIPVKRRGFWSYLF